MKNVKSVVLYDNYILFENGRWFSIKTLKFLKPFVNDNGYERVDLCVEGQPRPIRVFTHIKLVEHFGDCNGNRIPQNNGTLRELGLSIDHRDRNKHHNNRQNLELVTHQENCRRKFMNYYDYALPF